MNYQYGIIGDRRFFWDLFFLAGLGFLKTRTLVGEDPILCFFIDHEMRDSPSLG